jgi:SAM-dependent methyltransferase
MEKLKKSAETNSQFYLDRLKNESIDSPLVVGWNDAQKAEHRYSYCNYLAVSSLGPFSRVLDYGCGLGDLYKYLTCSTSYVGVDVLPEYIEVAKRKHPEIAQNFHVRKDFEASGVFDVVFCIGTFTLRLDWTTDAEYFKMFLDELKYLLSIGASVLISAFHNRVDWMHPDLYYHNLSVFPELAKYLNCRLVLSSNAVSPYEFEALFIKK